MIRAEVLSVRGRMVQLKFENGLTGSLPIDGVISGQISIQVMSLGQGNNF